MAGFLLGAGSGVLAGAAVYYTISTTIAQSTEQIRRDLHTSAVVLERSFDDTPGPAPSSFVGPRAGPPSFGEVLKHRWNAALAGAFHHTRETDWIALGEEAVTGVRGQLAKLSSAADEAVLDAEEGRAVAAAAQVSDVVDGGADLAALAIARDEAARGRYGNVNVDRGVKASDRNINSPKRLV